MSLVGRHIGRYRILEQLGQGGMSVVYKGLDTALDREVAVKVLHPHLSGKADSRKRLAREAKAVAKLHHPNILEVFDFAGVEAEDAYIVTEYIRGQTLRAFASAHSFEPPELAAMVIHELAAALAHAHDAGVIHRDLKPENVMVRDDGVLKLMDFGIAKIVDRDDKMTMTGALVGSPAHMAPEIIEGEEAGAEADVFSLGTMLYSFATGRLPFTAGNTTATLKRILDGTYEDPRQIIPSLSDDLAEIIATCLMRQPAARYPNATKLRDALGEYLANVGFPRVNEELASFFSDPPSYRKQMVKRLTEALVTRGEKFLAEKRPAKALANLNQVLALETGHPRAMKLLEELNLSRRRQLAAAKWKKTALAAAGLVGLVAAGAMGYRTIEEVEAAPAPGLAIAAGTAVKVPESAYPRPKLEAPKPVAIVTPVAVVAPPASAETTREIKVAKVERPAPTTHKVTVNIRPFGYLQVDKQPRSEQADMTHVLELPPGKHTFVVTCDGCTTAGAVRQHVISGPMKLPLVAPLKDSALSFTGFPPEAVVKLLAKDGFAASTPEKLAASTVNSPLPVRMPPSGYSRMMHDVLYEVRAPGYKPLVGRLEIAPGKVESVTGSLEKE
jgi:serine/threonine-protein kinase